MYEEKPSSKDLLSSTDFYITLFTNKFILKTKDKNINIKTNSLQELSNEINKTTNPNVLNEELSLGKRGLPVCLVNQYRVYQMTTKDVEKNILKKISRYLTDNKKKSKSKGGFVSKFNVMTGGAESEESPLVNALNNLLSIKILMTPQKQE